MEKGAPENKMLTPAEIKAGRPAEPAQGAVMCSCCGAWLKPEREALVCPRCRMKVRP